MSIEPSDESLTTLVADTENCELSLFNRLANLSAEDCTGYRGRERKRRRKKVKERGGRGKIGEKIHVHVVGGKEVKRGERKKREREREGRLMKYSVH